MEVLSEQVKCLLWRGSEGRGCGEGGKLIIGGEAYLNRQAGPRDGQRHAPPDYQHYGEIRHKTIRGKRTNPKDNTREWTSRNETSLWAGKLSRKLPKKKVSALGTLDVFPTQLIFIFLIFLCACEIHYIYYVLINWLLLIHIRIPNLKLLAEIKSVSLRNKMVIRIQNVRYSKMNSCHYKDGELNATFALHK